MKEIQKELGPQKLKHQPRCGHGSWGESRTLHKHTKINKNQQNERNPQRIRPPEAETSAPLQARKLG